MSTKLKKYILLGSSSITLLISLILMVLMIIKDFSFLSLAYYSIMTILSFIPVVFLCFFKKLNMTYLSVFYTFLAFFSTNIYVYIFSMINIFLSIFDTKDEKGNTLKIIKKYPVISSFVIVLIGSSALAVTSIFSLLSELNYGFSMLGEFLGILLLFILAFLINKKHLIFKNKPITLDSFFVAVPFLIYSVYVGSSIFAVHLGEGYPLVSVPNMIVLILFYLFVGIFEDFLIRGLSLNLLLDKFKKTKKGIWVSLFLSSLFFGLMHFTNIFTGATFEGVLIQVIGATCIGMYFGAIYLRTGNVWLVGFLHGFYDIFASASSFFIIQENIDISLQYGEAISNYSWASLIIDLIFVLLTLFLLRRKKMKEVIYDEGVLEDKKDLGVKYLVIFIFTLFMASMFKNNVSSVNLMRDYAVDYFENIPFSYDVYSKDGLSNSDKLKLSISSFIDLEKDNNNIDIDDLNKEYKKLFNDEVEYKDFSYDNYDCKYESDKYICGKNESILNNLKYYVNIKNISFSEESNVVMYIYYLVEDLDTGIIYADSNLDIIYEKNYSISEMTGEIYQEDSNNNQFWKEISEVNNGYVPVYKLEFDLNKMGNGLYLIDSELVLNSIYNNGVESVISNDINFYEGNFYGFKYDKSLFRVEEINNYIYLYNDKELVLEIGLIDGYTWLEEYGICHDNTVELDNFTFYRSNNDYYVYVDDFYKISINTDDNILKSSLLDIISSLEFYY